MMRMTTLDVSSLFWSASGYTFIIFLLLHLDFVISCFAFFSPPSLLISVRFLYGLKNGACLLCLLSCTSNSSSVIVMGVILAIVFCGLVTFWLSCQDREITVTQSAAVPQLHWVRVVTNRVSPFE